MKYLIIILLFLSYSCSKERIEIPINPQYENESYYGTYKEIDGSDIITIQRPNVFILNNNTQTIDFESIYTFNLIGDGEYYLMEHLRGDTWVLTRDNRTINLFNKI